MSFPIKYLLADPFQLITVPQVIPDIDGPKKKPRRERRKGRNWRPTWGGGRR